jgi:hypothetical protein
MQARLENLKMMFYGLQKTGIPLIAYDSQNLFPAWTQDDIGIYVIIPKLALLLNCSIESAINIFFLSLIIIPGIIGILGFLHLYTNWLQRTIAGIAILFCMRQAYFIGDVYCAYYAGICALVPWALYFAKKELYNKPLFIFNFCSGFFIKLLSFIRAYSGFGVLLFTITLFLGKNIFSKKQLITLFLFFLAGSTIPELYFSNAYNQSIAYAQSNLCTKNTDKNMHILWHTIYIGFGLLKWQNTNKISYNDTFGIKKVHQIKPDVKVYSTEYENILKNEVINLIKNHWNFFIFTLFAKIGILLFYLLKYANIGLLTAFLYRKPLFLELPFWVGMSFYALFPLLGMPTHIEYVLGFITFVIFYAVISINYGLEITELNFSFAQFRKRYL